MPDRSHRAEKYSNDTGKHMRGSRTEERISELEDKAVELPQSEKGKKEFKKLR